MLCDGLACSIVRFAGTPLGSLCSIFAQRVGPRELLLK